MLAQSVRLSSVPPISETGTGANAVDGAQTVVMVVGADWSPWTGDDFQRGRGRASWARATWWSCPRIARSHIIE